MALLARAPYSSCRVSQASPKPERKDALARQSHVKLAGKAGKEDEQKTRQVFPHYDRKRKMDETGGGHHSKQGEGERVFGDPRRARYAATVLARVSSLFPSSPLLLAYILSTRLHKVL